MVIKKYFQALLFDFRRKRAIRMAKQLAHERGMKFLVLVYGGKPVVMSMQQIKSLIRKKRFSPRFTPELACRMAIYIAYPTH